MSLLKAKRLFKPMKYPEAYEFWNTHDKMTWHWDEVPLADDVTDFTNASEEEKEFITSIMKLFTQSDVEVSNGYNMLMRVFKPTEVQMMLGSFNDRESTHIAAYSLFTETLGFPDSFYEEFVEVPEMKVKIDYLEKAKIKKYEEYADEWYNSENYVPDDVDALGAYIEQRYKQDIMRTLAVYATATEGISLFAQFAMLLKFQYQNKYKGLGTIVEWSIKDEEQHVQGNSWLFRTFVKENSEYLTDEVKKDIYSAVRQIVEFECDLVDMLNPPHIDKDIVKDYIKYIADQRLKLIGFKANYDIKENPLPFMEDVVNVTLTNMFEGKVTEYGKAAITGSWEEVRNGVK